MGDRVQWTIFVHFDCLFSKYSFFLCLNKCMHIMFILRFTLYSVKINNFVYFLNIYIDILNSKRESGSFYPKDGV